MLRRFRRDLSEERGNCFLYGCVTLVILALLGGLVLFLTLRYAMTQFRDRFTEATPVELPTVDMPQGDIDALIKKIDAYSNDLRGGKALEPITLTQDDLNALLQNHPDLKETFGDHMYVTLGDSTITTQMSFPLDKLPFPVPMMGGRYFNGIATFDVGFVGQRAQVFLRSASVKGEEVPLSQVQEMRGTNFAEEWSKQPDPRSLMDKVESIKVSEDGITITPVNKAQAAGESAPADAAAPETAPDASADGEAPAEAA